MITYEDWCVGCPKEMGCLGDSCRNRNVPVYECDECHDDALDELYVYKGQELCYNCFIKQFEMIDDDLFLVDDKQVKLDELIDEYCDEIIK